MSDNEQCCAECGAGEKDKGLALYCVKCIFDNFEQNQNGVKMKLLDWILLICVTSIAVSSALLAYRPSDDLNRLQEEKTALEIKILQHELKAYEDMEKEQQ